MNDTMVLYLFWDATFSCSLQKLDKVFTITVIGIYFRCRNFQVEKLLQKEKCAKFCAFRVEKLSRMDPIGKFCMDKLSRMENVFY